MIGIIIPAVKGIAPPFDPDNYFDPITHIATESHFIKLLEDGFYTEDVIGYKVQLGNSTNYNNGIWVIADVNHDSENTEQTDCYDLISENSFYEYSYFMPHWRSSNPRTWLNYDFYNGFNTSFKEHMLNPKYRSVHATGNWFSDDKIILPSFTEMGFGNNYSYVSYTEGIAYPIFTNNASRIKKIFNSNTSSNYWTRSLYTSVDTYIVYINSSGNFNAASYEGSFYLAPVIRVQ